MKKVLGLTLTVAMTMGIVACQNQPYGTSPYGSTVNPNGTRTVYGVNGAVYNRPPYPHGSRWTGYNQNYLNNFNGSNRFMYNRAIEQNNLAITRENNKAALGGAAILGATAILLKAMDASAARTNAPSYVSYSGAQQIVANNPSVVMGVVGQPVEINPVAYGVLVAQPGASVRYVLAPAPCVDVRLHCLTEYQTGTLTTATIAGNNIVITGVPEGTTLTVNGVAVDTAPAESAAPEAGQ